MRWMDWDFKYQITQSLSSKRERGLGQGHSMQPKKFQTLVLTWFEQHGRKTLPWQAKINPYRVWISEIMLQQTQVATVIDYFQRFIERFPTLNTLAQTPIDDVLPFWSGLGYYARARNLHRCAQIIAEHYHGKFPDTLEQLIELPGIGKSTAGAILAIAFNKQATILDGNVKRVLQRFFGIQEWYGQPATLKQLWELAETLTPKTHTADYTQAMMDLGATICTRARPKCPDCPLQKSCIAFHENLTTVIPISKPKKQLPTKHTLMLILENKHGEIYLEKRPDQGIWGGLWSLPEADPDIDIEDYCANCLRYAVKSYEPWDSFKHTFSHYHLMITPVHAKLKKEPLKKIAPGQAIWYKPDDLNEQLGLAAPVKKLLNKLFESTL